MKIINTKNGKRFDRLYSITHTDIFEFYQKLLSDRLAPIAMELSDADGFAVIDYNTETLAASVSFHNISNALQEKIREFLGQDD